MSYINDEAEEVRSHNTELQKRVAELEEAIAEHKQLEEELTNSQLKYRQLFETMTSGVAIYEVMDDGDDFIFREFNQAGENIEKVKREDVIGRRVTDVFPGVREFGLFKVFQRVWRTGKPEYFPEAIYKDGPDPGTWLENCVYRLPSGEIVSVYNDITERKRAEEALRENEEKFRTIFDSINDAVFIHDVETGAILDVNRTMCEMYGYSREEVDQLDIQALSSGEVPYTQQDALEWIKKAAIGEAQVFEWMARHKSGHLFWVEVSLKKAVIGLRECLLVVARDITERNQSEDYLRESEQRLREAQKIARIGMWDRDLISNRLQWSDSIFELFEIDPGKFKASYEAFLDTIHPADRDKVNLEYTESLKTKLPYEISHRLLMKDGRIKWVNEICRTEYDSQGKALRSVGIVQDITERKQAEEELKKRMNELETFYRATLGREERVIELKQEVNELLEQFGKNRKYRDYSK